MKRYFYVDKNIDEDTLSIILSHTPQDIAEAVDLHSDFHPLASWWANYIYDGSLNGVPLDGADVIEVPDLAKGKGTYKVIKIVEV